MMVTALFLDKVGFTLAGVGTFVALLSLMVVNQVGVTDSFGVPMFTSSDVRPFLKGWIAEPISRWLAYGPGGMISVGLVLVGVVMQLPLVWTQH